MLNNFNQTNSFEQFLFLHFNLNDTVPVTEIQRVTKKNIAKCKTAIKKTVRVKKELKAEPIVESAIDKNEVVKKDYADLTAVIDSIPDKVRAMNLEDLAHKHESEWYHAFRDLKEEISEDLSKRHSHCSTLKKKSEVKELTEVIDAHIEKVILELERIFQVFPTFSRIAVLYLLAIVLTIPLIFFSINSGKTISYNFPEKNINVMQDKIFEITEEMKSNYIAMNSAKIIASGKDVYEVNDLIPQGKVAGVYEENEESDKIIKQKVSKWYDYLNNIKDELGNFFSK